MNRLTQLRKKYGLTTRTLEEYTGVSSTVITYLELERRPFRQVHIDKLTSFFNVTSDYLLGKNDSGLIAFTTNGTEIILSEKEYHELNNDIEEQIIKVDNSFTFSLESEKIAKTIMLPPYQVYREIKATADSHKTKEFLSLKLKDITKGMSVDELNKTILFIETYILK